VEAGYKVAVPRREVREGRSFNPDEFAIALEQVVAGTAPEDYRDPAQFFARTCFTRALREHAGMVLRRLSGKTEIQPALRKLVEDEFRRGASIPVVPPEVWNRLGTKILPKLRSGSDLRTEVGFAVTVKSEAAGGLATELRQVLQELGLTGAVRVEEDAEQRDARLA